MNWEPEKAHCKERNWTWTLDLIERFEKEIQLLQDENKMLKDKEKAQRLYNSCNY